MSPKRRQTEGEGRAFDYATKPDNPESEVIAKDLKEKWCKHCNAVARPTKDGKHRCQCRREPVK